MILTFGGYSATITIKDKVAIPAQSFNEPQEKTVIRLNKALASEGLLDNPWRAKIGGARMDGQEVLWVLLIGKLK